MPQAMVSSSHPECFNSTWMSWEGLCLQVTGADCQVKEGYYLLHRTGERNIVQANRFVMTQNPRIIIAKLLFPLLCSHVCPLSPCQKVGHIWYSLKEHPPPSSATWEQMKNCICKTDLIYTKKQKKIRGHQINWKLVHPFIQSTYKDLFKEAHSFSSLLRTEEKLKDQCIFSLWTQHYVVMQNNPWMGKLLFPQVLSILCLSHNNFHILENRRGMFWLVTFFVLCWRVIFIYTLRLWMYTSVFEFPKRNPIWIAQPPLYTGMENVIVIL